MHPADIAAALKRKKVTQAEVAAACGVVRGVANAVVRGVGRSKKVEAEISNVTGIPLEELWPQWYPPASAKGNTVSVRGDRNVTAGGKIGHVVDPQTRDAFALFVSGLTPTEERLIRLYRALEPGQQEEVEQFMRKKLAGN